MIPHGCTALALLKRQPPKVSMEFLFQVGNPDDRKLLLQHMVHTFGLTYICLWSSYFDHQSNNYLRGFDGIYQEESGILARQLFDAYRVSSDISVDLGQVPGLAFASKNPYMELKLPQIQSLAYSEGQWQFYREARIKTVIFMGCALGEIELGMSTDPHIDLKMEVENFVTMLTSRELHPMDPSQQPPSSSSSSIRSLSVDSPEYPPILFNVPPPPFIQEHPISEQTLLEQVIRASTMPPPPPALASSSPHQQAIRTLSQMRNSGNPNIEQEDESMRRAILAVLSMPSTPSSAQQTAQNLPPVGPSRGNNPPAAFRRYQAPLAPAVATRKRSMFKRAVMYFSNLEMIRRQESQAAAQGGNPRPMTAQSLQHTIQERRRRRKINDSFQLLRSLLPPASKKDKASVLSSTTEYLRGLKSEVAKLMKRNLALEAQVSAPRQEIGTESQLTELERSAAERVSVETTQVSSSSSEARFLDLRVTVRGELGLLDLSIRVLNFLKQQRNLNLISVESNTRMLEQNIPVHTIMIRLKLEGNEFDEATFQEAVRRAVDSEE